MPEDYMMRLIEQMTQMLAAIMDQKMEGGNDGAMHEIKTVCLRVTGLPFDLVKRYSPEALIDLMQQGADAYQKSILLAELLIQYAQISRDEGRTADEIASTLQAYCLILESIGVLNPEEKAAYRSKLNILAQKLSVFKDNPYIQEKLTRLSLKSEDRS
jgi:hypothetical protein